MPKTVLVVDDNADSRDLLHLYLTTAGYGVLLAGHGSVGLYNATTEHPDLIITDITMPIMDGVQLTREVRAEPSTATTPIIALTAYGKEAADRVLDAGANLVMGKPVLLEKLIEEVKKLIGGPDEPG